MKKAVAKTEMRLVQRRELLNDLALIMIRDSQLTWLIPEVTGDAPAPRSNAKMEVIDNTLLMVSRTLTELGVEETYRSRGPQDASLEAFAVHGSVD